MPVLRLAGSLEESRAESLVGSLEEFKAARSVAKSVA